MAKELILYTPLYRYSSLLEVAKVLTVSQSGSSDLVISTLTAERVSFCLACSGHLEVGLDGTSSHRLSEGKHHLAGLTFFFGQVESNQIFDVLFMPQLSVGSSASHSVSLLGQGLDCEVVLSRDAGFWQLLSTSQPTYVNNRICSSLPVSLTKGDQISFESVTLTVFDQELWVKGARAQTRQLVPKSVSAYQLPADYPDYHRSPRIIYREPEDKISLRGPVEAPQKPANQLLKVVLPPLLMIVMTIVLSFFQSRGIYVYVMIISSVVSTIFSITGYFKGQKEYRESLSERESLFRAYLFDKSQDLYKLQETQRQGQLYHYPSIATLFDLAQGYHHRIYEKTPQQFDFLSYRLGLGERASSYQLSYAPLDKDKKLDDLEQEGLALYNQYKRTQELPIVTDLMSGPVGYIGPRHVVLEQLQLLVNQLAFFHSYHDVQFITLVPESETSLWTWMRWLPHARLKDLNVRGLVYNQRTRDQVLNSLYQILKLRKHQQGEKGIRSSTIFSPHYVVMITDQSLIIDHVIMEFFTEDPTSLGCSVIFVEDTLSSLSENITTIIDIKDRNVGVLHLERGDLIDKRFNLDHFPVHFDKEGLSRLLAPLNHLQNLKSSIPELVTFMGLYGAEDFKDLEVLDRWQRNAPYKSLAVPLGLRGKDDLVYLNLHEKAHGPHGLVAGTTGSGKSEIIQSYILSLAVNFHPHDVAFLLIDYKGGGMANLFKDLPHLLGTITNLDGAQSMRALVSINAELKRRQRLFSEHEVNHINQYQKKHRLGEVSEPMPHLFLISDEFAELKANQPEFMSELVSTARIGRSLGIHLILATQKPTGVVNDQIWSNSRFKLALKVADRQDSQEMLRTPDAADITQPGRAYLQVGNNEVYELFQSAWSGADYQPDKADQGISDQTIYAINDLGQYEILNDDLSGLDQVEDIRQVPSELDAIVSNLKALAASQGIVALPQPWLPPLPERISLDELHPVDFKTSWRELTGDIFLTLGQADVPQAQNQEVVSINLSQDGSLLLYGSPGSGKSTFLQASILDLARTYSPEKVNFYLLDFGTNALASYKKLPHLADVMRLEETEKIQKFIRLLDGEIGRRKKLMSDQGVSNLSMYSELTGRLVPSLVIVLDSFESMKDEPFEADLFKLLTRISREGLSIGLHLLVTAGRQSNLRATFYGNIKHQLTLTQHDKGEVRNIVGPTPLSEMEDIKGRGLMRREEVDVIQFALPYDCGSDVAMFEAIRSASEAMSAYYRGRRPQGIPMVPEELTVEEFLEWPGVQTCLDSSVIPLGLEKEWVVPVGLSLSQEIGVVVANQEEERLRWVERLVSMSLKKNMQVIIFSDTDLMLSEFILSQVVLEFEPKEQGLLLQTLLEKLHDRQMVSGTYKETLIVWYNYHQFLPQLQTTMVETLLSQGPSKLMYSTVICDSTVGRKVDVISDRVKRSRQGILQVRLNDQTIFTVTNKPLREAPLESHQAYLVKHQQAQLMSLPI